VATFSYELQFDVGGVFKNHKLSEYGLKQMESGYELIRIIQKKRP
jgi:hypothetical protein